MHAGHLVLDPTAKCKITAVLIFFTMLQTPQCYCLVLWSIIEGRVVALEPVNGVGHRLMGAYLRFACHFYPGCVANAYHRFLTPSASFLHAAPTPASLQARFWGAWEKQSVLQLFFWRLQERS